MASQVWQRGFTGSQAFPFGTNLKEHFVHTPFLHSAQPMLSSSDRAEGTPLPVVMMVKLTSSLVLPPALSTVPQVTVEEAGPEVVTPHGPALTDYPTAKLDWPADWDVVKVMGVELADVDAFIESIERAYGWVMAEPQLPQLPTADSEQPSSLSELIIHWLLPVCLTNISLAERVSLPHHAVAPTTRRTSSARR